MITNRKGLMTLKMIHLLSVISVVGGFLCILVLLMQNRGHMQPRVEAAYDSIMLVIFNTVVTYGAILLVATTAKHL